MAKQIAIRNLQIITAIDSISFGMLYRFVPAQVLKLGGSHSTAGLLAFGLLQAHLLSPEITKLFTNANGMKQGLFIIQSLIMLSHVLLATASDRWLAIFARIVFEALNQTGRISLQLLLGIERNECSKEKVLSNWDFLTKTGYVLGPILGGYLLDNGDEGKRFFRLSLLASFLTLVNIIFLSTVSEWCYCSEKNKDEQDDNKCQGGINEIIGRTIAGGIENVKKCRIGTHWDLLLLKFLYTAALLVFYSHLGKIMLYNFSITRNLVLGCTIAFANCLAFISNYYAASFKASLCYPLMFISEMVFFLMTFFMVLANIAPTFQLFLLLLVPVTTLKSLVSEMWIDLFSERENEYLSEVGNFMEVLAGLTVPLLFGITCDHLGSPTVALFSCLPLLICWIIIRFYSKTLEIEMCSYEDNDESIDECRINCL